MSLSDTDCSQMLIDLEESPLIKKAFFVGGYAWTGSYGKDLDISIVPLLTKDIEQYTKDELQQLILDMWDDILAILPPDKDWHFRREYITVRNHYFTHYDLQEYFTNRIIYQYEGVLLEFWTNLVQDKTDISWVSTEDFKARSYEIKTLKT